MDRKKLLQETATAFFAFFFQSLAWQKADGLYKYTKIVYLIVKNAENQKVLIFSLTFSDKRDTIENRNTRCCKNKPEYILSVVCSLDFPGN